MHTLQRGCCCTRGRKFYSVQTPVKTEGLNRLFCVDNAVCSSNTFHYRMERCRRMAVKQVSCAVCRPKNESHRGRCAPGKMCPKCAHDQPGSWSCHETESNRLLASFSGTRSRYAIAAVVLDGACCRRPAPPMHHTETKKQLRGLGATVVGSMTELNRPHHVPNVTCSPNTPMELC